MTNKTKQRIDREAKRERISLICAGIGLFVAMGVATLAIWLAKLWLNQIMQK